MELEDIKLFMRVDNDDEDSLIQALQASAVMYLKNAGVTTVADNPLYILAVKLLVLHWYENRNCIDEINNKLSDLSLSAIINQLRYTPKGESL